MLKKCDYFWNKFGDHMSRFLQYGLLLCIFSVNTWATESYQIEFPLKPSITIEVNQKSHVLSATEHQSIAGELKILSQNYWSAYQGTQLSPQCVLRVQESQPNRGFIPMVLSVFNDNRGMVYIESPINDAQGGVATGIPQNNIPAIVHICQKYWQPVVKNIKN